MNQPQSFKGSSFHVGCMEGAFKWRFVTLNGEGLEGENIESFL